MQLTFGDADGTWMRCARRWPPSVKLLPLFVEELRQIDVLRIIREAPEKQRRCHPSSTARTRMTALTRVRKLLG